MGYPMTYLRVVSRNNLQGGYRDAKNGVTDYVGLICGDLRRLEVDARDEAHIKMLAKATGATKRQVQMILDHFFDGLGIYVPPKCNEPNNRSD